MSEKLNKALEPKSDQLNSDDLLGGAITIKITKVVVREAKEGQQLIDLFYDGDGGKPYRPGKSMGRVLREFWGGPDKWVSKSLTLYRDPEVIFGGLQVGGIRISHMSNIEKPMTMALTASKAKKKPFTVKPLTVAEQKVDPEVATLKAAGDAQAKTGTETYKAWLATLSDAQKEKIRQHSREWSVAAKAADDAATPATTDEEIPV